MVFFFFKETILCHLYLYHLRDGTFDGSPQRLTALAFQHFEGSKNYLSVMLLWRRKWQPTPVFLPGKSHGRRSLVGYGPWGSKELDTDEQQCAFIHCPLFLTFFPNSSMPSLLRIFIEWINAFSNVFMMEYSVSRILLIKTSRVVQDKRIHSFYKCLFC